MSWSFELSSLIWDQASRTSILAAAIKRRNNKASHMTASEPAADIKIQNLLARKGAIHT